MNGYKVQVGCQEIVFETSDKLLTVLRGYLNDPKLVEQEWIKNFGLGDGPQAVQPTPTESQFGSFSLGNSIPAGIGGYTIRNQ
jgi:hypothetical protein